MWELEKLANSEINEWKEVGESMLGAINTGYC